MHGDGSGALLFGGLNGGTGTVFDELWRFDGVDWTLQVPANGVVPPPRSRFAACFDPVRQRLVVFGGDQTLPATAAMGDTWEWNPASSTWTQFAPVNSPSPRYHARMAYDLLNARVLLFGGSSGADETWTWDGVDWTQQQPVTVPPGRQQPGMCTDWSNGNVILFGGSGAWASGIIGDTWVWNGFDWTQVLTATVPGGTGIRNGKLDYDVVRQRAVCFGGVRGSGGFSDSVWEFDGVDWTERLPTVRPLGRAGPGFCFVDQLGTSVLFGGYNGGLFNDTWTYQTSALAAVATFGAGCPSTVGVPTLSSLSMPWAGDTLTIGVGNVAPGALPLVLLGLSDTAWVAGPLPQNLAVLGFAGCDLLVSPDVSLFAPAPVGLPLPLNPALAGVELFAQAAALQPLAQGFDLSMSAALRLTIGVR